MDTTRSQHPRRAFTRIELMAVIAVLVMLAGLLLPALAQNQGPSQRVVCMNNLKQAALSFRVWEGDYNNLYPARVPRSKGGVKEDAAQAFRSFQVMSNELDKPKVLICPADSDRQPAPDFVHLSSNNVSYFVGVDADDRLPAMLLAGDRNLAVGGAPLKAGLVTVKKDDAVSWTEQLHQGAGNVGLADGSVQQVNSAGLPALIQHSGAKIDRLAIP